MSAFGGKGPTLCVAGGMSTRSRAVFCSKVRGDVDLGVEGGDGWREG